MCGNLGLLAPQQVTVLPELLLIQVCSQLLPFCLSSGCKGTSPGSELSTPLLWSCLAAEQLMLQSKLLACQFVCQLKLAPFQVSLASVFQRFKAPVDIQSLYSVVCLVLPVRNSAEFMLLLYRIRVYCVSRLNSMVDILVLLNMLLLTVSSSAFAKSLSPGVPAACCKACLHSLVASAPEHQEPAFSALAQKQGCSNIKP